MHVKGAIINLHINLLEKVAKSAIWFHLKKKKRILGNTKRSGRSWKTTKEDDHRILSVVKKKKKSEHLPKSRTLSMRYEYHYPGFTAECHPLVTLKNGKGRLNFEKTSRRHPQTSNS